VLKKQITETNDKFEESEKALHAYKLESIDKINVLKKEVRLKNILKIISSSLIELRFFERFKKSRLPS